MENFGIKYVEKEHVEHLLKALKKNYKFTEDWEGDLDCGIKLDWNYKEGFLDISMPGYTKNLLQRVRHEKPAKPQHSPYRDPPLIFGTGAQNTILPDESPKLDKIRLRRVQQVIGGILCYAHTVDITVLPALGTIPCEQSQATEMTKKKVPQLLDYLATKLDAKVLFYASSMVINILHSDTSYLSEP